VRLTLRQMQEMDRMADRDPGARVLGSNLFHEDWPVVGGSDGRLTIVYPSGRSEPCPAAWLKSARR
jgi:hypothetical protein